MRRPIKLLAASAAVLIIAVGAWFIVPRISGHADPQQSQTANSNGGRGSQAAAAKGPVPVMAGKAASQTIPIIVRGIGNVAAFNEVAIKSRVDGNITKIFYREGQFVRIGDPLIQIDPRPTRRRSIRLTASRAKTKPPWPTLSATWPAMRR